ncbi:unnamed protein product [Parascedosporium putredinis]|uniref:Uncharacterized protein n=1 Tax=Parascedosporium putredinis TaxID=1442378 RepID=A0A9P1H8L5_9PEZI|nr:unnamed protein product [Parascedosporium putredinis]CAI7999974.1 unnamed protein product [Parascedosporium putredinis]
MDLTELDAHEAPADWLRAIWKGFSRMESKELNESPLVTDPRSPDHLQRLRRAGTITAAQIAKAFSYIDIASEEREDAAIYYHPLLPGLLIIPNLLTPEVQETLLSRMIHRDLSNPKHQTNLHLHYAIPYPQASTSSSAEAPFGPQTLSIKQVLERRLHWVTLGGHRHRKLLHAGDTMMLHRDVSEETDKGLISLSMGCDGLFMIAPNDVKEPAPKTDDAAAEPGDPAEDLPYLLLRIRSGTPFT